MQPLKEIEECNHKFSCIDSRRRDGYRYRRYRCDKCNDMHSGIEIICDLKSGDSAKPIARQIFKTLNALTMLNGEDWQFIKSAINHFTKAGL